MATEYQKFFEKVVAEKIKLTFDVREQPLFGIPVDSCKTNLFFGCGHAIYRQPFRSHALITRAFQAAVKAKLNDDDMLDWYE